jgi:hypothetical protein
MCFYTFFEWSWSYCTKWTHVEPIPHFHFIQLDGSIPEIECPSDGALWGWTFNVPGIEEVLDIIFVKTFRVCVQAGGDAWLL